jgi:hypothetical protein
MKITEILWLILVMGSLIVSLMYIWIPIALSMQNFYLALFLGICIVVIPTFLMGTELADKMKEQLGVFGLYASSITYVWVVSISYTYAIAKYIGLSDIDFAAYLTRDPIALAIPVIITIIYIIGSYFVYKEK